jgi:Tfp pilus assembly protein PilN
MEFYQINLTTRDHADRRIIYAVLGTVAAVMILFTLFNVVNGIRTYQERRSYLAKIEDLQRQAETLAGVDQANQTFDADAAAVLQKRSRHVNHLIALDIFPWVDILNQLEETIPDQIVLDRFLPAQDLKSLQITGRTLSMEQITQFQDALGKSELFQSVVLENIDVGTDASPKKDFAADGIMQFEMICGFNLRALFPKDTYGELWMAVSSTIGANGRKR